MRTRWNREGPRDYVMRVTSKVGHLRFGYTVSRSGERSTFIADSAPAMEVPWDLQFRAVEDVFSWAEEKLRETRCSPRGCRCAGLWTHRILHDARFGYPAEIMPYKEYPESIFPALLGVVRALGCYSRFPETWPQHSVEIQVLPQNGTGWAGR